MAEAIELGIDDLTRLRPVAAGGFATVYAAWDSGFRRWVAVKVLAPLDEDGRRRFDRERALMGRLDAHPNVVTPYRSGYTDSGAAYLVMEYLEGGSLQDLLHKRGSLSVDQAVDYLLPVTDAISSGHRLGILHRDIKPANILLSADGVPKLADFGISTARDATTTQAAFTLAHAPPESFADGYDRQDERSDFYSLASTLYTLIRGRGPFDVAGQDSTSAQLMRILTHSPAPIGRPDVDAFFATGLAKKPDDRFQTAEQMADAIGALSTRNRRHGVATVATVDPGLPDRPTDAGRPDQPTDAGRPVWPRQPQSIRPPESGTPPAPVPVDDDPSRDEADSWAQRKSVAAGGVPNRARKVAAVLGGAVIAVVVLVSVRAGPDPGSDAPESAEDDVLAPVITADRPGDGETGDTSVTTGPGPGSFSVGELRTGLLVAEDLPSGWTADDDIAATTEAGVNLACDRRFEWPLDSSSPQVVGRYHAPGGGQDVEHTVWVLDVWVATELFDAAASVAADCEQSWLGDLGAGDGGPAELVLTSGPTVTSHGDETVSYATTASPTEGGDERQVVTIFSRCGGLTSRLVVSTSSSVATDGFVDELGGAAYSRLVAAAEFQNATCPRD